MQLSSVCRLTTFQLAIGVTVFVLHVISTAINEHLLHQAAFYRKHPYYIDIIWSVNYRTGFHDESATGIWVWILVSENFKSLPQWYEATVDGTSHAWFPKMHWAKLVLTENVKMLPIAQYLANKLFLIGCCFKREMTKEGQFCYLWLGGTRKKRCLWL